MPRPFRNSQALWCLALAFSIPALAQTVAERQANINRLLDASKLADAEKAAREFVSAIELERRTDTEDYAAALDLLARVRSDAGAPLPETRPITDRALALRTRLYGPDTPQLAPTLTIAGVALSRTLDFKGAVQVLERSLALQQKAPSGGSPLLLTETLNGLGTAYARLDNPKHGIELHQRSLALREQEFGPGSVRVADTCFLLGDDEIAAGNLAPSIAWYQRALRIYQAQPDPDNLPAARTLGALASRYAEQGELLKAKPLHEQAIKVHEKVLGLQHPRLVVQYNNYGNTLRDLGDYTEARKALEHAVEMARATTGPESSYTAQTLANLGIVFEDSGDPVAARNTYETALKIQEKRLGPEHQLVASILNSLGLALIDLGERPEARRDLERSLAIYRKTVGPEYPKTIQVMVNLANLLAKEKDYPSAKKLIQDALQCDRRTLGENNLKTAATEVDLATLELEMGEISTARTIFTQALATQEAQLGAANPLTGNTFYQIGLSEAKAGHPEAAIGYFARADGIWRKSWGPDYFEIADALEAQAEALVRLARWHDAVAPAIESARVRRENVQLAIQGLGEHQALAFAAKQRRGLNIAVELLAAKSSPQLTPSDRMAIWNTLIRERALVFDQLAQRRQTLNASPDSELALLDSGLKRAREQIARAVVQGSRDNPTTYALRVAELRKHVEDLERRVAARSAGFRHRLDTDRAGLDTVLDRLPARSALVSYARTGQTYVAFAIPQAAISQTQREPLAVSLGDAAHIDQLIAAWRREIDRERDSLGRSAARNEQDYRIAALALRHAIWDPLAPAISGASTVFIVPDADLQLVNFAALPSGKTGYLAESAQVLHLLSSERDLLAPSFGTQPAPASKRELLAVGNPAFSSSRTGPPPQVSRTFRGEHSSCADFSSLSFADLPASAAEAQAIFGIWKNLGGSGLEIDGSRATEGAVKELAPGKQVIHLATHGFFVAPTCRTNPALLENPLLRAGLALAGANHRTTAGPNQDDGILTAEEVASLNLEGTEWVVLSGCDTGLGVTQPGEGLMGLRRAFRVAGAGTLISSLWAVDDQDARQWMLNLYRSHFVDRAGTAQAVRTANLRQLRARRLAHQSTHPFYWAGFIAVGVN